MKRTIVRMLFISLMPLVIGVIDPSTARAQQHAQPADQRQEESLSALTQLTQEKYRLVVFADLITEELRDVGGIPDVIYNRFSSLRASSIFMGSAGFVAGFFGSKWSADFASSPAHWDFSRIIAVNTKPVFGFALVVGGLLSFSYSSSFALGSPRNVIQFESDLGLSFADYVLGYRANIVDPIQESLDYHSYILGLNAEQSARLRESLTDAAVAASLDLDPKTAGPIWVDVLDVIQKTRNIDGSPLASSRVIEAAARLRKDLELLQERAQARIELLKNNHEFQDIDVEQVIAQDRKLVSDWILYMKQISEGDRPMAEESRTKLNDTVARADRLLQMLDQRKK